MNKKLFLIICLVFLCSCAFANESFSFNPNKAYNIDNLNFGFANNYTSANLNLNLDKNFNNTNFNIVNNSLKGYNSDYVAETGPGLGIAGFIVSTVGLFFGALPCGITGTTLSSISLAKHGDMRGFAIAGLTIGIIDIVGGVVNICLYSL